MFALSFSFLGCARSAALKKGGCDDVLIVWSDMRRARNIILRYVEAVDFTACLQGLQVLSSAMQNPYWKTFNPYVEPLLEKPMELRRFNELESEK